MIHVVVHRAIFCAQPRLDTHVEVLEEDQTKKVESVAS